MDTHLNMKKIKNSKPKVLNILGIRFELWEIIDGYRLSVDTNTTRYIFKPFGYCSKCGINNLI